MLKNKKLMAILANPKNSGEYFIAANHPDSKIYKKIEKETQNEISITIILQAVVEWWIQFLTKTKIQEREEMIKQRDAIAILTEKKLQEKPKPLFKLTDAEIEKMHLKQLQKLAEYLPIFINNLKTETEVLKNNIKTTNENIAHAGETICAGQQKILDTMQNEINKNNIHVYSAEGDMISAEKMIEVFNHIAPTSPGEKIFKMLHESNPNFIEKFDSGLRANECLVIQQFTGLCDMCRDENDEVSPFAMLKQLRLGQNKPFMQKWNEVGQENKPTIVKGLDDLCHALPKLDQHKKQLIFVENEINKLEEKLDKTNQLIRHQLKIKPEHP